MTNLVGGIDAHAKNYSIMHAGNGGMYLAPLYDLTSVLPYVKVDRKSKWRHIPMSIGGQTKIGALTGSDIQRFAKANDFADAQPLMNNMEILATNIPRILDELEKEYPHIVDIDTIMSQMKPTVARNCEAMLDNLGKTHDPESFVKPGLAIINSGELPRKTGKDPAEEGVEGKREVGYSQS